MTARKTLYLLRHAKAETGGPHQEDRERALTERGIAAAGEMGHYLRRSGVRPDLILCSSAARTRETLHYVEQAYGETLPVGYTDALYLASVNEIAAAIAAIPDTIARLLIVGHNPDLHALCLALARAGDRRLRETLSLSFPTCAFAAFDLGETTWREIRDASGTLIQFVTPKMLEDI